MPRKLGPQITLEDIVSAAAAVLARDGYEGLTMRAVAAQIGVRAPSLYWHVKGKEDLSRLLFDQLIDNLDYGPLTGDWRADLRSMAERLRAQLVGTRDITRVFPENYASGPHAIRSLERGLGLLRQAGVPAAEAMQAYAAALSFIVGWAQFEVTQRANEGQKPPGDSPDFSALPNLAWALTSGDSQSGYDHGFRYGVDLLIAGLEQRLTTGVRKAAAPMSLE